MVRNSLLAMAVIWEYFRDFHLNRWALLSVAEEMKRRFFFVCAKIILISVSQLAENRSLEFSFTVGILEVSSVPITTHIFLTRRMIMFTAIYIISLVTQYIITHFSLLLRKNDRVRPYWTRLRTITSPDLFSFVYQSLANSQESSLFSFGGATIAGRSIEVFGLLFITHDEDLYNLLKWSLSSFSFLSSTENTCGWNFTSKKWASRVWDNNFKLHFLFINLSFASALVLCSAFLIQKIKITPIYPCRHFTSNLRPTFTMCVCVVVIDSR